MKSIPLILAMAGWLLPVFTFAQCPIDLQFDVVYSGYNSPVEIAYAPDSTDRLFIVEKSGYIRIIRDGIQLPDPFLDIDARVSSGGERGLLGLAFHPNYESNGLFYVNYTGNDGDTRIAKYSVSSTNPDSALLSSEEILLEVFQPQSNHNAGDLLFGPDGYLYIPLGDGGGSGDPDNYSQDSTELLGKLLRIDVDTANSYRIPPDNPYQAYDNVPDEVWAFGLRNPWRASFDRQTGDLWIADVGQGAWEEVNVQPASSTGAENYGWRCYEGDSPFNLSNCPDAEEFTFPVSVYPHNFSTGGFSITGGYVYRGTECVGLQGAYIYADYVTNNVFVITGSPGDYTTEVLNGVGVTSISTFGEDKAGELYAASLDLGVIYRVLPADLEVNDNPIASGEYCSYGTITSNGFIESPSNVFFIAGKGIELQNGFEVAEGASFTAEISN